MMAIPMSDARAVAREAIAPIAYVMAGEAAVGRCRLRRDSAVCPGRVYGDLQDIRLKVRMRRHADGTYGYVVYDIVDASPTPDPAP